MAQNPTVAQWLHESLATDVCNKAITNIEKQSGGNLLHTRASSPEAALVCSFSWVDTPEGHDYWDEIHKELKNNQQNQ